MLKEQLTVTLPSTVRDMESETVGWRLWLYLTLTHRSKPGHSDLRRTPSSLGYGFPLRCVRTEWGRLSGETGTPGRPHSSDVSSPVSLVRHLVSRDFDRKGSLQVGHKIPLFFVSLNKGITHYKLRTNESVYFHRTEHKSTIEYKVPLDWSGHSKESFIICPPRESGTSEIHPFPKLRRTPDPTVPLYPTSLPSSFSVLPPMKYMTKGQTCPKLRFIVGTMFYYELLGGFQSCKFDSSFYIHYQSVLPKVFLECKHQHHITHP